MLKSKLELVRFSSVLPGASDASTPLPMWDEAKYEKFLKLLEDKGKDPSNPKVANQPTNQTPYHDIAGAEGKVLSTLRSAYTNEKFWSNYLYDNVPQNYYKCAWSHFIPVIARIKPVIRFAETKRSFKVSVIPRVLLFPTGWCMRLSLQIDGPHTLSDLKDIAENMLERNEQVFVHEVGDSRTPIGLEDVWKLTDDAGQDVFGGAVDVRRDPSTYVMSSALVLEEYDDLNFDELGKFEKALQVLVRSDDLNSCHIALRGREPDRNFFLSNEYNYFLWFQYLLDGNKYDRRDLECYHSNTLLALIIHWQERHLLYTLDQRHWKDSHVERLANYAYKQLNYPPSASPPVKGRLWNKVLRRRLGDSDLIDQLKKVPEDYRKD